MILVLGNAGRDITLRLPRLPRPGETVNATGALYGLGGKGLNQAVAAHRAGAEVVLVAPIGDDGAGAEVTALLEAEGMTTEGLLRRAGPSDLSTILVDAAGQNLIATDSRLAEGVTVAEALPWVQGLGPKDTLLLQGNLTEAVTGAALRATWDTALSVFNPSPLSDGMGECCVYADIVIVNAEEAFAITGRADPAETFRNTPLAEGVVTLGAAGCLVTHGRDLHRIPAPPTGPVVDTAGAGDTFAGVFVAEHERTGDRVAAARFAVAAASLKVTRPGTLAGIPSAADIAALRRALPPEATP